MQEVGDIFQSQINTFPGDRGKEENEGPTLNAHNVVLRLKRCRPNIMDVVKMSKERCVRGGSVKLKRAPAIPPRRKK